MPHLLLLIAVGFLLSSPLSSQATSTMSTTIFLPMVQAAPRTAQTSVEAVRTALVRTGALPEMVAADQTEVSSFTHETDEERAQLAATIAMGGAVVILPDTLVEPITLAPSALAAEQPAPDDLAATAESAAADASREVGVLITGAARSTLALTTTDGFQVYPDIAADTDAVLRPFALGGVEVFAVQHAPQTGQDLVLSLQIPSGAQLGEGPAGSVEVLRDGETLATFGAPWALDAAGARIPVAVMLEGSTMRITPSASEIAYPLVIGQAIQLGAVAPPTTAAAPTLAALPSAQLRVFEFLCIRQSARTYSRTQCFLAGRPQIYRIAGYNQNNAWSVWEPWRYPSYADGNNVFFVRGWWWRFERGVSFRLGSGAYYVQTGTVYQAWLNVGVRRNCTQAITGQVSCSGYSISTYATNS